MDVTGITNLLDAGLLHRMRPILLTVIRVKYQWLSQAVVAHSFNLSNQEAEAGGSLSSRPAWSTE